MDGLDNLEEDDLNLDVLKCFLEDQSKKLQIDKWDLRKLEELKQTKSGGNYGVKFDTPTSIGSNACGNMSKTKNSSTSKMVKNISGSTHVDPRELEKEKLINSLSVPKSRYSSPSFSKVLKSSPNISSPGVSVIDFREKEKDRLAAIFAASKPSYLSKVSNNGRKNVDDVDFASQNQQLGLNKATSNISRVNIKEYPEEVNTQKSYIPEIFVSEYKEESKTKDTSETEAPDMVRIGEFSPLNPNNLGRRPSLGIGEYGEERQKLMLDRRKQEYNEYLQQAQKHSRSPTPSRDISPHSRMRTVATQTVWDDVSYSREEKEASPKFFTKAPLCLDRELQCGSPSFRTASPVPKCFDDAGEKEIKELIYREDLKRQIEEKNRLKEQMKKREEEEEARIEAKIQRDLEKMRRQYEEERLQRLELAIRRKEQEDLLRQRLADEQLKTLEESRMMRKQCLRNKSIPPNDKASQKSSRSVHSSQNWSVNQSLPLSCASNALSDVHEIFRQPLLEVPNHNLPVNSIKLSPPERDVPLKKKSALNKSKNISSKHSSLQVPHPPNQKVNEVNIPEQRGVVEPNMRIGVSSQTENKSLPDYSQEAAKRMKEVEEMLRAPLTTQTDRVLLPTSPPLVDTTIPPYIPTLQTHLSLPASPPIPAAKRSQRTNCEILEDKWKVPNTKSDSKESEDVYTSHNRSVLTQLGAFRRHLQQERLRMQQRVRDDSP